MATKGITKRFGAVGTRNGERAFRRNGGGGRCGFESGANPPSSKALPPSRLALWRTRWRTRARAVQTLSRFGDNAVFRVWVGRWISRSVQKRRGALLPAAIQDDFGWQAASLSCKRAGCRPIRFSRFNRFSRFGIGLGSVYDMRIWGRKGAKNRFTRFRTVYGERVRKPIWTRPSAFCGVRRGRDTALYQKATVSVFPAFSRVFSVFRETPFEGGVRTKTEICLSAVIYMMLVPDIYLTKTAHELRMPA
jgi:hypothetical protein